MESGAIATVGEIGKDDERTGILHLADQVEISSASGGQPSADAEPWQITVIPISVLDALESRTGVGATRASRMPHYDAPSHPMSPRAGRLPRGGRSGSGAPGIGSDGANRRGRTDQTVESGDATDPGHLGRISAGALPGVVVRAYGKYFDVQLNDEPRILLCTVKGSLKRERRRTDLVAVGDRVWAIDVGEGEGQIEAVEPRTRALSRLARNTQDVEQVILANPDQVLFLFAVHEPEPNRRMLDRFLVLAESAGLPAIIGVNKIDLDGPVPDHPDTTRAEVTFGDYRAAYPVRYLSVAAEIGVEDLREDLKDKVTAVAGPSGVGKSSLLNALHPEGDRAVGAISAATGKGRHTTIATQLYRIGPDTYVADTPGIRALALHSVPSETLDRCFPELRPYLDGCFYHDCTHLHEPGCAVREALEAGMIAPERYESYAALRRGDQGEE